MRWFWISWNGLPASRAPTRTCSTRGEHRVRAFPVWEEACDRGFVERASAPGGGALVVVTMSGRKFLLQHGRPAYAAVPERGAA